ncbi:hypothetical protein P171DRAFT_186277 [Karstenula rhodostoma CBS 690.94]|uniref:C2H2-type domain-containing protein n=1 Tax=Karstenula rhodostoma CBS 690.94 TaxID=1392251 RepID=A0A9P4PUM9_9PLEO|nr:hypothetical protein P171DRAFT_186277 [Karstenula rhodostoma CBS 690.94]
MEAEHRYDEESLQHIYALLRRHRSSDVIRMVLDIAQSRPASTITSASHFSHLSSESRHSGFSTDYAPSLQSSVSSRSRPRRESPLYRSGLNPTKPVLASASPISEAFSPVDTLSIPSPLPVDIDSRSITSSTPRRCTTSSSGGPWFCTFCTEHTSFAAKADWKKHETKQHETGEDWPCPIRNCLEVLDRKLDFEAHFKRHHPDVPCPTDVRVRLLPRLVYGCGFDGCKAILTGWKERCDHVALHMKPKGTEKRKGRTEWKYSNTIHNLLRQDATRSAWKSLFTEFESKQPRYQITWSPENTRILRQKLECCDMRPNVLEVVHTALSLREGRPFNDAVELDADFKTPSQDSVPGFDLLSDEQLTQILSGRTDQFSPPTRPALSSHTFDPKVAFTEPHPGDLVAFNIPSPTISGRRISYMDVDTEDFGLSDEGPDPQIPPGLELDPSQMSYGSPPKPFQLYYPHAATVEEMPQQRRSSRGHILTRHFKGRKT